MIVLQSYDVFLHGVVTKEVPLYIDGRKYYNEEKVHDLNEGVGGEYIYLYTCREKYAESDGKYYYLNTGGHNPVNVSLVDDTKTNGGTYKVFTDPGYGCRSFAKKGWFDVNKYVHKSYTAEGHKFVERVLQLYTPKKEEVTNSEGEKEWRWIGKHECDIELNRGAGGDDVRMIFSYATKEGGY